MYQDFENTTNPELIEEFEACYRKSQQESELQEMFENGKITDDDISPIYRNKSKEFTFVESDLPF